jgi:hypothetical protein
VIAEFVEDDDIVARQSFRQSTRATGGFLLFELVCEIDQIEEAASCAGANDRPRHGAAMLVLPFPNRQ